MKKLRPFLLVLCMLAGCKMFSKKPKFYIETPDGWSRTDTTNSGADTVVRLNIPQGTGINDTWKSISLVVERDLSNDPQKTRFIEDLKSDASFFEKTGNGHRVINGIKAYWFQINVKYKAWHTNCTQRHYFISQNGFVYTFICTTTMGDFERMRPDVDEVLNTFKISEE